MSERASRFRATSRVQAWSAAVSSVLFTVGMVDMVETACRPHFGGTALLAGLVLCVASTAIGAYGAIQARTVIAWTLCIALALLTGLMVLSNFVLILMCGGI